MFSTCFLTVATEMIRRSAIARFDSPAAISRSTSSSRALSGSTSNAAGVAAGRSSFALAPSPANTVSSAAA